jgi:hypothetical protein
MNNFKMFSVINVWQQGSDKWLNHEKKKIVEIYANIQYYVHPLLQFYLCVRCIMSILTWANLRS